jgi:hypothetical protein
MAPPKSPEPVVDHLTLAAEHLLAAAPKLAAEFTVADVKLHPSHLCAKLQEIQELHRG